MSASQLRAVHSSPSAEVLAVWRAMPGAYLLLGRAAGPLPKSGSARLNLQTGTSGIFRTFLWPLGSDAGFAFLTAIRLSDRVQIGDESEIVMRGARASDRDFRLRLAPVCEEESFGRQLAATAGSSPAALVRFMLDLMRPEAEVELQRPVALMQSFLQHVANHEGCVELILELPQRTLLLQGWGAATGTEIGVVTAGTRLLYHAAQAGEFFRADVKRPLVGNVLVLPPDAADELSRAESIFLLTREQVLCRRILDGRIRDAASSAGQVRHLLPRLVCPADLRVRLQEALLPRYEGIDTLNSSGRRVRAALDVAVFANGAGVFLSGWLFDPTSQIAKVDYCDTTRSIRLDLEFVRIVREDVVAAFKSDTSFPASARSDIGIAGSANFDGAFPESARIRFTFTDDDIAFMPLTLQDATNPSVRELLWRRIDMHKPSGAEIVQRHLAPFVFRAPLPEAAATKVVLRGPLDRRHSLVVPLRFPVQPRAIIAGLLPEPLADDEQIIFVCGAEWGPLEIDRLIALSQCYDLPATILTVAHRAQPIDAVLEAATRSQSETFLVLAAPIGSRLAGTRDALRDAIDRDGIGGAVAACPTMIYEDGSIKFAGSTALSFAEGPPFARLQSAWLGLSSEHIEASDPADAAGGTLDCCMLNRQALPALERARRFTTRSAQEAALFSSLRDLGCRVLWLPAVVVATTDEIDAGAGGSAAALVDNWMLRAFWGEPTCAS